MQRNNSKYVITLDGRVHSRDRHSVHMHCRYRLRRDALTGAANAVTTHVRPITCLACLALSRDHVH